MTTITLSEVLGATQHCLTGQIMTVEGNKERRADGIETGNCSDYVSIGTNNVWGALGKDDSRTSSVERIGYHTGSVDFIIGVLSTDCPVYVYRQVGKELTKKRLVP